jgi:hypothetical protein
MDINKEDSSLNKVSKIVHELAQSLLIIHAYVRGCIERIKNNNLDFNQFSAILSKINEQINLMFSKLQLLIQYE